MTQKQTDLENMPVNGFDTYNDAVISTAIKGSVDS